MAILSKILLGCAGCFHAAAGAAAAAEEARGVLAGSVPTYVSVLTLVITVIAVVVALIGIAGAVFSFGLFKLAHSTRKEMDQIIRDAKDKHDQLEAELKHAGSELRLRMAVVRAFCGAFHPSGGFLSDDIKGVLDSPEFKNAQTWKPAVEEVTRGIARAVLANSEFGVQIQCLYTGDKDARLSSIGYLSQKPSKYSLLLLKERLESEKCAPDSDPEMILALDRAIRDLESLLSKPPIKGATPATPAAGPSDPITP
jgi:hypothetical protein